MATIDLSPSSLAQSSPLPGNGGVDLVVEVSPSAVGSDSPSIGAVPVVTESPSPGKDQQVVDIDVGGSPSMAAPFTPQSAPARTAEPIPPATPNAAAGAVLPSSPSPLRVEAKPAPPMPPQQQQPRRISRFDGRKSAPSLVFQERVEPLEKRVRVQEPREIRQRREYAADRKRSSASERSPSPVRRAPQPERRSAFSRVIPQKKRNSVTSFLDEHPDFAEEFQTTIPISPRPSPAPSPAARADRLEMEEEEEETVSPRRERPQTFDSDEDDDGLQAGEDDLEEAIRRTKEAIRREKASTRSSEGRDGCLKSRGGRFVAKAEAEEEEDEDEKDEKDEKNIKRQKEDKYANEKEEEEDDEDGFFDDEETSKKRDKKIEDDADDDEKKEQKEEKEEKEEKKEEKKRSKKEPEPDAPLTEEQEALEKMLLYEEIKENIALGLEPPQMDISPTMPLKMLKQIKAFQDEIIAQTIHVNLMGTGLVAAVGILETLNGRFDPFSKLLGSGLKLKGARDKVEEGLPLYKSPFTAIYKKMKKRGLGGEIPPWMQILMITGGILKEVHVANLRHEMAENAREELRDPEARAAAQRIWAQQQARTQQRLPTYSETMTTPAQMTDEALEKQMAAEFAGFDSLPDLSSIKRRREQTGDSASPSPPTSAADTPRIAPPSSPPQQRQATAAVASAPAQVQAPESQQKKIEPAAIELVHQKQHDESSDGEDGAEGDRINLTHLEDEGDEDAEGDGGDAEEDDEEEEEAPRAPTIMAVRKRV
jgi:hypothetical protein